jgi:hypothetical protein
MVYIRKKMAGDNDSGGKNASIEWGLSMLVKGEAK